ncbi:MAG TPA: hypothetical protein VLT13_09355 [Bacteroidota bacterium]|nr:hypothetical protein [Bacteroidota bacterium]
MTTKAPSPVKPGADNSLENIAYASVAGIPVAESHDRDRLGYSVWLWLTQRRGSLDVVVSTAAARLQIPEEEALTRIRAELESRGIAL